MNNYEYLYKLTQKAYNKGEIPVACIILNKYNKIISYGINDRQNKNKITGHAEINAILKAEKKIKDWRLNGYKMIVTLKPCNMCQTIIKESRLDEVYYILDNENNDQIIDNLIKINDKELEKKFSLLISDFFRSKR